MSPDTDIKVVNRILSMQDLGFGLTVNRVGREALKLLKPQR